MPDVSTATAQSAVRRIKDIIIFTFMPEAASCLADPDGSQQPYDEVTDRIVYVVSDILEYRLNPSRSECIEIIDLLRRQLAENNFESTRVIFWSQYFYDYPKRVTLATHEVGAIIRGDRIYLDEWGLENDYTQ